MRRAVRVASCLLALALGWGGSPGPAAAREKRPPPASQVVETVGRAVYEELEAARRGLADERYADAEKRLRKLLDSGKLNSHERALVHQTLGYVHSGRDRVARAIESFQQALSLGALPESSARNMRFDLGRLHLIEGRVDEAIEVLRAWFEEAPNPSAAAHMTLAAAYAHREESALAFEWAERGLARMEEPQETWMRLGAQLSMAAGQYARAAYWLTRLIEADPLHKSDWMQLVAVYGALEREEDALAALSLADRLGLLESSQERRRLVQLQLFRGIPLAAAQLLERDLAAGRIEDSQRHLELLANAWTLAREDERAREPLTRAAEAAEDGRLWLRLGRIHLNAGRWADAQRAIERALARGGLDDEGAAQLLLGVARYERGRYEEARRAFERALAHRKTRPSARVWLELIATRGGG
ncbi:MAG: tetratricopeptide repeat protein [Myxococcota bacterium]|nr:tetratricopeptide repeat protein [Myxococcota bacterium]